MSCVFENIDPPRPSPPGECVPPAFVAGGGHTRQGERGVGGQYFGRRKTQLCALPISNPLCYWPSRIRKAETESLLCMQKEREKRKNNPPFTHLCNDDFRFCFSILLWSCESSNYVHILFAIIVSSLLQKGLRPERLRIRTGWTSPAQCWRHRQVHK